MAGGALAAVLAVSPAMMPANAAGKSEAWAGDMPFLGWPDPVDAAVSALTLHYLNTRIYRGVECKPELVEEYVFVRCYPIMTEVVGGIYVVTDAFDEVSILPLNGKAKTHLRNRRYVTDVENDIINVLDISDQAVLDVQLAAPLSAAIKAFGK